MQPQLQSAGLQWPATVAAHHAHLVSASAPSGPVNNLSLLVEDQLELTERDLWEDDAETSETEAVLASTSAPSLDIEHSSESEHDPEPPSPDIKAFHGDPQQQLSESPDADATICEDTFPECSFGRRSTDSARGSTDSTSAMPIAGSLARHRSRRPPLRANSTFASRDGVQRRASIKMGSSAPINIPMMSRLPSFRDEESEDAAKKAAAFVPPHLLDAVNNNASVQQRSSILTGISPGASVKREKLQQRNAILRRTGFIEGPVCTRGMGGVMDPIRESHLEKEGLHSNPSALTAALGSSPAVGSSS